MGAAAFLVHARQPAPRAESQTAGTTIPSTVNTLAHSLDAKFQGFIQFTGNQFTQNAANPYLAGASMDFYWSELEPQQGQYQWSVIENAIQPWTSRGKKVIIRVTTSGNCYPSQGQLSCHRTPDWVLNEGVRSLTDPEGSVHPAYWDPAFLGAWQQFIQAFAAKYDGDPRIIAVNLGDGNDGELRVDRTGDFPNVLQAWTAIGYSQTVWHDALLKIMGFYVAAFHKTPLAMQTGQPYLDNGSGEEDSFLNDVHSTYPNLWFQDDALSAHEAPHGAIWADVPHIEEPGKPLSQSGDTLDGDIRQALNMQANYIYIFGTDLTTANQAALARYFQMQ